VNNTRFERLMPPGRLLSWLGTYPGQWMALVWVPIMLAAPVMNAISTESIGGWAMATGIALAFAGTVIVPRTRWRHAKQAGEIQLVVLAGMACSGILNFGFDWISVFALLAIACGVALDTRGALPVILFVTAFGTVLVAALGATVDRIVAMALTTFLAGLGNFVVHYLVAVIAELRRTRQQLALAAVDRERVRFSRDLHDLLGHTLSVIVVKAEAVRRLVDSDAAAASAHAQDIEDIGRRALTEVREAVGGYRNSSLPSELDHARRALEAARVDVTIDWDTGQLDEETEEALAWAVREGATNVVRHSRAQYCTITITQQEGSVTAEIVNDGAVPTVIREGTGLSGLRDRMLEAGGSLIAEPTTSGFRLFARLPGRNATSAAGTPDTEETS
jgi:two-component system sensor histidine kinase DesK